MYRLVLLLSLLAACSQEAGQSQPESSPMPDMELQVEEYIRLFPYQDTYNYGVRYTGADPANLNRWVAGSEAKLIKAGEDKVVRTNNDTFYKSAFVYLEEGPVYLEASVPDRSRFVSFQLMDDRNVNYRNLMFPNGQYTLYFGQLPDDVRGEAIEVPSALSVVIVRVEVKDVEDAEEVAAAEEIFNSIRISGSTPSAFPELDLLSRFPEDVVAEANRRLDEALKALTFREMIVGPGKEPGEDVPYLNHSAGTKGGWGGPDSSHSAYEVIFFDEAGEPLMGSHGTYSVTTEEPPVDAFWSVTVYDTDRGGFLHPNKRDRYHINNTTAAKNDNGSVTFTFKQDCGSSDLNCIEVPRGRFDVVVRYYLPDERVQTGSWTFPGIRIQSEDAATTG